MTIVLTSRQLNRDTGRAKRAAKNGPVFITHRGRRAHVLLTIEDYSRLVGRGACIVDLLAMPAAAEVDFEPSRLTGSVSHPVDLT